MNNKRELYVNSHLMVGHPEKYRRAIDSAVSRAASETAAPSAAQAKAGNYRKGKVTIHGLPITIETPKGGKRTGKSRDGKEWSVTMRCHYGYINGTVGSDGDHVDVYIGPCPSAEVVFVIDQQHKSGRFDEHKCFIGWLNKSAAVRAYRACYSDNSNRIKAVRTLTIEQFKSWLKRGNTKKPIENQKINYSRFAQQLTDAVDRYAKRQPAKNQGEFRWITIGGEPNDKTGAKHEGGTPVQIDGQGNIKKGPAALAAKGITNLDDFGKKQQPKPAPKQEDKKRWEKLPHGKTLGDINKRIDELGTEIARATNDAARAELLEQKKALEESDQRADLIEDRTRFAEERGEPDPIILTPHDQAVNTDRRSAQDIFAEYKAEYETWAKRTGKTFNIPAAAEYATNDLRNMHKNYVTSGGEQYAINMIAGELDYMRTKWQNETPSKTPQTGDDVKSDSDSGSSDADRTFEYDPETHGGYKNMFTLASRVEAGEMDLREYQDTFAGVLNNREQWVSDLKKQHNAKTLQNIAGNLGNWHAKTAKKDDNANWVYERLMQHVFEVGDGMSATWTMTEIADKSAKMNRLKDHVAEQTAETLAAHVKQAASNKAARKAEKEKADAALDNPETLHDFERAASHKGGYLKLTPDQQAKFDELKTESTRGNREETKAPTTVKADVSESHGGFDLTTNYHSKRDADIYTASPNNRVERDEYNAMNRTAKQLGGWYYRAYKGTPGGFHFKDEESRNKFLEAISGKEVDRSDILAKRAAEKGAKVRDKLSDHAVRMETRAMESLNTERRENTARQQGMADSARSRAESELQQSARLKSLAQAIESGDAKHLKNVTAATHLESLQAAWRSAAREHREQVLIDKYGDDWRQKATYDERQEVWQNTSPLTAESIAHATMPLQKIYPSDVSAYLGKAAQTAGLKMDAKRWQKKFAGNDDREMLTLTRQETRDWFDFAAKAKRKGVTQDSRAGFWSQDTFNRLYAIGIQDDHELRAALREFVPHQQAKHGKVKAKNPVAEMEKKIHREHKAEGFYPTPPKAVDRLLELADISSGHTVFEPSAGSGRIMDAVKAAHGDAVSITGMEKHVSLMELLGAKGHEVENGDFLQHKGQYDRIVMNPPFERDQAIDHVQHAFEQLKPGGKLVAVVPGNDRTYREGGRTKRRSFAEFVDTHGEFEALPEDSFKGSDAPRQTGVNTSLVVLTKPDKYSRLRDAVDRYAKGSGCNWITLNADRSKPKGQRGGTPVKLCDGKISAGPKELVGKKIKSLGKQSVKTKRRDALATAAKKHGVDKQTLEETAQALWQQKRTEAADFERAKKTAREMSGMTEQSIARIENGGRDYSTVERFDEVARELQTLEPALGLSASDPAPDLWALLREGKRSLPTRHDAALLDEAAEMIRAGSSNEPEDDWGGNDQFSRRFIASVDRYSLAPLEGQILGAPFA